MASVPFVRHPCGVGSCFSISSFTQFDKIDDVVRSIISVGDFPSQGWLNSQSVKFVNKQQGLDRRDLTAISIILFRQLWYCDTYFKNNIGSGSEPVSLLSSSVENIHNNNMF